MGNRIYWFAAFDWIYWSSCRVTQCLSHGIAKFILLSTGKRECMSFLSNQRDEQQNLFINSVQSHLERILLVDLRMTMRELYYIVWPFVTVILLQSILCKCQRPAPPKKTRDPPYGEKRSVRILLECIPVYQDIVIHGILNSSHFKYIFRYTYQATITVFVTMMLSTTPLGLM